MDSIILASASPRRRELLSQIGIEYEVIPSKKEEVITSTVGAIFYRQFLARNRSAGV